MFQNQCNFPMNLFRITENWRIDMILLFLKWFCFIENLIEWQNSQKAYKKQTLAKNLISENAKRKHLFFNCFVKTLLLGTRSALKRNFSKWLVFSLQTKVSRHLIFACLGMHASLKCHDIKRNVMDEITFPYYFSSCLQLTSESQ